MDIVIHSMGMPFGPETIKTGSLGGSETAAYYLAQGLAKKGHRVTLFTTAANEPTSGDVLVNDGVSYCPCGEASVEAPLGRDFEHYAMNTPHDVLVIQRHPLAFHKKYASKVNIWQLHDLALKRSQGAALAGTWQIDAATCVSRWHADQVKEVWGLTDSVLRVVPNGVDPKLYEPPSQPKVFIDAHHKPGQYEGRIVLPPGKFLLLYQSRPERGLEHLVRPGGIMDRLRDLPVHLVFCGYENTVPQMAAHYQKLMGWAAALSNCSYVGALSKPVLAELQRKCDLLVYPTQFEEVSCITAMEAMHATLPILTSECGALPETCDGAGVLLVPLKDGQVDEDAFVAQLEALFGHGTGYPLSLTELRDRQLEAAPTYTWDAAVEEFCAVVNQCFERRHGTSAAILRTALERSDIDFARWYGDRCDAEDFLSSIYKRAFNEIVALYNFTSSDHTMAEHYARHTGDYYDQHQTTVVGEDVTHTTRYRAVENLIWRAHVELSRPLEVLDYGCAHGHYLVPLAQRFITSKFTGMDLSDRAVAAAQSWLDREKLQNAAVMVGGEERLTQVDCHQWDVVLAAEVLEHARDWRLMLNRLLNAVRPGGMLIVTTPFGPWERSDPVKYRTFREHLVHFERHDIEEILADFEYDLLCAPAGVDQAGETLGSWVWWVKVPEGQRPALGDINYERKLAFYAPRQTISACLIVKDGAQTLRKCVESFVDWVDEVRIFVDPRSSDLSTYDLALQIARDFPHRAFTVSLAEKSARRDGFDEARNESVDGAFGDWILWVDADEEVYQPGHLQRLARPSMHDGYGFAQMHYALDPPQVLTTDYPCRMYRNHIGVKFYGVVHEHPEQNLGEAVKTSIIRPEVKLLHNGYIDEATRRGRFQRNFPLLTRDREKYPERRLNAYLWLRDLAQSLQFEQEQMGGLVAEEHVERARDGIRVFEEMVTNAQPPRMIEDAMPYYSHCVQTVGEGFDAMFELQTQCAAAPTLHGKSKIQGRFHNREFFKRLMAYLTEESTKVYEEKYI